MTAAQLKLFFTTVIKVVAGGPAVGTPGSNRAAGLLQALNNLVDFVSGAGQTANVPLLDPSRTDYPQGYEVRAEYGGASYLFYSINGGGPHAAPADFTGDNNWGPVAPQAPPTVLGQLYPLGYAQYQLSRFPGSIKLGQTYEIPGQWNGRQAPDSVTVEVLGGHNGFGAIGTLVEGTTRTAVKVDVAAGTYSADLGGGTPATLRDIYAISAAKRTQVKGLFSGSQFYAADQLLSGDTHGSYLGCKFPDNASGDMFECMPDPTTPNTAVTNPDGSHPATETWYRY